MKTQGPSKTSSPCMSFEEVFRMLHPSYHLRATLMGPEMDHPKLKKRASRAWLMWLETVKLPCALLWAFLDPTALRATNSTIFRCAMMPTGTVSAPPAMSPLPCSTPIPTWNMTSPTSRFNANLIFQTIALQKWLLTAEMSSAFKLQRVEMQCCLPRPIPLLPTLALPRPSNCSVLEPTLLMTETWYQVGTGCFTTRVQSLSGCTDMWRT